MEVGGLASWQGELMGESGNGQLGYLGICGVLGVLGCVMGVMGVFWGYILFGENTKLPILN